MTNFPPISNFRPILVFWPPLAEEGKWVPAVDLPVTRMPGGLINETFAVGRGHVLQRLHPVFGPEVNEDIAAMMPILLGAGVPVPRLVFSTDRQPGIVLGPQMGPVAGLWRMVTRLPGETFHRVPGAQEAESAGRLLGRFHSALKDSSFELRSRREPVHDTARHVRALEEQLHRHTDHRLHGEVAEVAEELFSRWRDQGDPPCLPVRFAHGDPKISNFLFVSGEASGLVDLDTPARVPLDSELGDAFRSWCASGLEESEELAFDTGIFEAGLSGWTEAVAGWITREEVAAIPTAIERITLELAARFASDALAESYFGWDETRFPGRGEHNLVRAKGQLSLARDIAGLHPRLQRIVRNGG
jgi:Ser/Thr protein kinase RdoA (MazF antagonist)